MKRDNLFFIARRGEWRKITLSTESSDLWGRLNGMITPAMEAREHARLRREIAAQFLSGKSFGSVTVRGAAFTVGTNAGHSNSAQVEWKWAESICDPPTERKGK